MAAAAAAAGQLDVRVTKGPGASAAFLRDATPFLQERRSFMVLGLAAMVAEGGERFPDAEFMVVREAPEGEVLIVGLRTTPAFKAMFSHAARDTEGAAAIIGEAVASHWTSEGSSRPLGVNAPAEVCGTIARVVAERLGTDCTLGMVERRLAAAAALAPSRGPVGGGAMRLATAADAAAAGLPRWADQFQDEVGIEPAMRKPGAELVDGYLRSGRLRVWELPEGGECGGAAVVAMAGFGGEPSPAGALRVSLVFTPPEHRRRGYAGAIVAALTAALLAEGAPYVGIVTDAANPTSNRVYESVGYRHVHDAENWWIGGDPKV